MQHKNNNATTKNLSHLSTTIEGQELEILKRKLPTDWVEQVMLRVNFSAATIRTVLRKGLGDHEAMQYIVEVAENHNIKVAAGVQNLKNRINKLITAQ